MFFVCMRLKFYLKPRGQNKSVYLWNHFSSCLGLLHVHVNTLIHVIHEVCSKMLSNAILKYYFNKCQDNTIKWLLSEGILLRVSVTATPGTKLKKRYRTKQTTGSSKWPLCTSTDFLILFQKYLKLRIAFRHSAENSFSKLYSSISYSRSIATQADRPLLSCKIILIIYFYHVQWRLQDHLLLPVCATSDWLFQIQIHVNHPRPLSKFSFLNLEYMNCSGTLTPHFPSPYLQMQQIVTPLIS